jgi:(2Fe-2S) ferredoxin
VSPAPFKKYQILVCRGPECGDKRHSADVFAQLEVELASCPLEGNQAQLEHYSCFGKCQKGPNVLVREMKPGENLRFILLMPTAGAGAYLYHGVTPGDARRIVTEHIAGGRPLIDLTRAH